MTEGYDSILGIVTASEILKGKNNIKSFFSDNYKVPHLCINAESYEKSSE